ncbi:MAG: fucose isomerase, partial [Anaerolineaceae bacterium]|nr:fucose isomerase [Anaerolineaceae bacterium]
MAKATLGLIVGNRGFFADNLVKDGRKVMLKLLKEMDIDVVVLDEKATKLGAVESLADSLVCADLFDAKRKEIEGILVTLPNFGDEKGIAETIKRSGLNVPIFLHAFPDDIHDMSYHARRDSFCGKLSVANNFYQYGIPYTITANHTIDPETAEFKQELTDFVAVCKVVNGMRKARIG